MNNIPDDIPKRGSNEWLSEHHYFSAWSTKIMHSALQQLSIAWADPGIQPIQYVRVLGMAGRPGETTLHQK